MTPSEALDVLTSALGFELQAMEEWQRLGVKQQRVLMAHLESPELDRRGLAERAGVRVADVIEAFMSEAFIAVNEKLARMDKASLLQLSLKTLRECLLQVDDHKVRMAAALKLLTDAGMLRGEVKTLKQDNKIMVVWSDGAGGEREVLSSIRDPEAAK